ncbi:MAG: PQQ-dependent sugar dehydrogenase [Gammaproteobacteria bacterium]
MTLAVEQVFSSLGFTNPVAMLQAPGDATRWFVVEQAGVVRVFDNVANVTVSTTFVNITSGVRSGGELGLLGMAFHPAWSPTNRRVFLSYTNGTNPLVSRISEFTADASGITLDPASERILLVINQPETNHNGGGIAFGPDGFLYIGMGDGGGGGDMHGTIGNGQNLMTLLGKMLRIDVSPASGYMIPPANPFATNPQCGVNGSGAQNCPEIFAYGFRNPWRWSFDRTTGELWVGDVGQNLWEEASRVTINGNYGWRCREGAHSFNTNCGGAQNLIDPVVEYGHAVGFSITGGYVYRGAAFPTLQGRYVFGDFGGRIWNIARDTAPTLDVTNTTAPVLATGLSISSFAEGNDGELYVVHHGGTLHRLRAL